MEVYTANVQEEKKNQHYWEKYSFNAEVEKYFITDDDMKKIGLSERLQKN